jgi:endonuclease G
MRKFLFGLIAAVAALFALQPETGQAIIQGAGQVASAADKAQKSGTLADALKQIVSVATAAKNTADQLAAAAAAVTPSAPAARPPVATPDPVQTASYEAPAKSASACSDKYVSGVAPKLAINVQAGATKEICYQAFALMHSAATRTGLWAAEHLTAKSVRAARMVARNDRFHEEPALSDADRAGSVDYLKSGYDRGHLAPSGDMPTDTAQGESFTLANMAPQYPALNRGLWEEIEETARGLAERDGELYVVTGTMFATNFQSLNGRVAIPSGFYKAIYNPRTHEAAAYVVRNAAGSSYQTVSITKLKELSGVDAFPALPLSIKNNPADLPTPSRSKVASVGVNG